MNILVTGANGGFGRLITRGLLTAGHKVAASIRDPKTRNAAIAAEFEAQGAHVVEIDVTSGDSVAQGVARAEAQLGSIDALINNAGVGAHGLQENFFAEDYRRLFEINVFGVQRMNRAVLPAMRARRAGLIVHISSLLGRVTLPFYGPYNASKWAVEALAENYRTELSSFGIEVCIVEPGGFPTEFMGNLMHPSDNSRDESYGPVAGAVQSSFEHFAAFLKENPQQNPQLVADAVVDLAGKPRGERPFRVEVDRIGMGDAIRGYNDHLAQLTQGLYERQGMAHLLTPVIGG